MNNEPKANCNFCGAGCLDEGTRVRHEKECPKRGSPVNVKGKKRQEY